MVALRRGRTRRVKAIYHPVYRLMIRRLTATRKKRGLTQERVSKVIGVQRQWVSKVEQYEIALDVISLLRLCRLYRIRAADLVGWMERRMPAAGAFFSLLWLLLTGRRVRTVPWKCQSCSHLASSRARSWGYLKVRPYGGHFATMACTAA